MFHPRVESGVIFHPSVQRVEKRWNIPLTGGIFHLWMEWVSERWNFPALGGIYSTSGWSNSHRVDGIFHLWVGNS